jgi:hypothetical protein
VVSEANGRRRHPCDATSSGCLDSDDAGRATRAGPSLPETRSAQARSTGHRSTGCARGRRPADTRLAPARAGADDAGVRSSPGTASRATKQETAVHRAPALRVRPRTCAGGLSRTEARRHGRRRRRGVAVVRRKHRARRTCPALSPEPVALRRVSLGHRPSLHRVRRRGVRRLLRYYGGVRLPAVVHHRRVSLDFPMGLPCVWQATAGPPGSRARWVGACAGSLTARSAIVSRPLDTRWRPDRCGLPPSSTASAPRSGHSSRRRSYISRLNTWPARSPVNASPSPSRATAHDSGPVWVATPLPYDSFIHDISPVLTGARRVL